MSATTKTVWLYCGPPRSAPMVPDASDAEATSVAADPMRPTRTSTGGVPNSGSRAMATSATARDGPMDATPPARKAARTSALLMSADSALRLTARI